VGKYFLSLVVRKNLVVHCVSSAHGAENIGIWAAQITCCTCMVPANFQHEMLRCGRRSFFCPWLYGVVVPILVGFVGEGSGRKVCEEAIGIVGLFQDCTSLIETSERCGKDNRMLLALHLVGAHY
jgi:hypothetical protein